MPQSFKRFFQQLPPFVLLGVLITLIIGVFVVFSYIFIWGLLIGGILWGVNFIVQYFRKISTEKQTKPTKSSKGRIIDHEK